MVAGVRVGYNDSTGHKKLMTAFEGDYMCERFGRRLPKGFLRFLVPIGSLLLEACTSVPNSQGLATRSVDSSLPGPVAGVGIESHDIVTMTDKMVRDMLANSTLAGQTTPPRVVVDAQEFKNDSPQAINKNIITDRLRVNLNRASQGRMVFVSQESARIVAKERDLKRQGVTDVGTTGLAKAQAGVDYKLVGRIASTDSRNTRTGMIQRFNQIAFEMIDMESGIIVWDGLYDFERAGADDVVYR